MNNLLSERNSQYRCEYEEATKRLQNTLKMLTSLLVAITGILAAAAAAFVPACTCKDYSVDKFQTVYFIVCLTCSGLAYVVDIIGILPFPNILRGGRRGDMQRITYGEESLHEDMQTESDEIDLRDYYQNKTEEVNSKEKFKQAILFAVASLMSLAVISLIGVIVFSIRT